MDNNKKNKLALITGAARGIGAEIAKELSRQGIELILVDKDSPALEKLDDTIQEMGGKATLVPFDLQQTAKIESLVHSVAERFQRLDILIGNAAVLGDLGPITDLKPSVWQEVMDVNLNANWQLLRGFNPLLKKSPNGCAIFLTSSSATEITPYWSAYAVSKAALEMTIKLYQAENKLTNPNLKIHLFDPGRVNTDLRKLAMPGEDLTLLRHPEEVAQEIYKLAA